MWNEQGHPGRNFNEDPGKIIDSIIDHLEKLLNSRQGTTLMDREFGLPDFTDYKTKFPESLRDIEKSIQYTIENYETRLDYVNVEFLTFNETDFTLSFKITAMLSKEFTDKDVVIESILNSSGEMSFRR